MDIDKRNTLREAVRKYVDLAAPAEAEEFDDVFDDVYDAVETRMQGKLSSEVEDDSEGLPFDAGVLVGTAISMSCWMGMTLLTAVVKYGVKTSVHAALGKGEDDLLKHGAEGSSVRKMREIIEGVFKNI